jgi:hypothetical protein
MKHKQISDVAEKAILFFKTWGKHPDLDKLVEVYRQEPETYEKFPDGFFPATVFEAFFHMYDVAQTDENKIIFKTVRILFDNLIE